VPGFDPGLLVPGFDPGVVIPGFEPGLGVPGFVDPGVVAPGFDPEFVDPEFAGWVPGAVGDPGVDGVVFGVAPGTVPFGFVDGCAVLPGAVGFSPGAAFPVGGAGVFPVGGAGVFPVGGADGDVWPGVAEPAPGGIPPAPAPPPAPPACATTQVAHPRINENKANFRNDIN
jgi:hypothetical protein